VFVTEDGGETDLDLGHYERFIDENLHKDSNAHDRPNLLVGHRQRAPGDYLGKTSRSSPM